MIVLSSSVDWRLSFMALHGGCNLWVSTGSRGCVDIAGNRDPIASIGVF